MAKKTNTTRTTKKAASPKSTKSTPAGKTTAKKEQLSAVDAAAKVLANAKEPMTTKQLVEAMTKRRLWTSPGGRTPDRTLYSAILREMNAKGKESRFQKAERGKFTVKA